MKRQHTNMVINDKHLSAEIKDGDVIGWQPISLQELNVDIDRCIAYLENIKDAIHQTELGKSPSPLPSEAR